MFGVKSPCKEGIRDNSNHGTFALTASAATNSQSECEKYTIKETPRCKERMLWTFPSVDKD